MLVSWNWLSKYIDLPMSHEELAHRLSLSGLNHESTEMIDDDIVIDLEVTSNRGDCLGHLGVVREIGVLYGLSVDTPDPQLEPSGETIDRMLTVENRFTEACPRYTARVIQGVTIGPSPAWMVDALNSIGIGTVNNVVDATNYVMMECGQPLHAFDYAKVKDGQIIVRPAANGETMEAIDHRQYTLDDAMCVIADAQDANAVAGVMGGARSEVDHATRDLVIEAAIFTPLSVRRTARKLKLHSPSSYRFERRVDPAGVDWASRRVCELIVEVAGGSVVDGVVDTDPKIRKRKPIQLRLSQLQRILGIEIGFADVNRILSDLGCSPKRETNSGEYHYVPPTWRHDLTREADLIEEVARIYGYEKIPEDAPIPVAPSSRRTFDIAIDRVRHVLTAAGISEAMTPSVVTEKLDQAITPWTERPALTTETAMLEGAKLLRRSLMPSLLQARANNWASASLQADLFEIAHIYLPGNSEDALPAEQYTLGIVSGGDFFALKGIVESLLQRMGVEKPMAVCSVARDGIAAGTAVEIRLADVVVGYMGVVAPKVLKSWKLPDPVIAAELSLPVLLGAAQLVPQQRSVSPFPSVQRDLNFIVAESVRWSEMDRVVRGAVGGDLADLTYVETYRDEQKDGKDRKRILMSVELQRHDSTLSGDQADELIGKVIGACKASLNAELLS
jgi:phenylalanyl-tRNA synthetase beta chain